MPTVFWTDTRVDSLKQIFGHYCTEPAHRIDQIAADILGSTPGAIQVQRSRLKLNHPDPNKYRGRPPKESFT